MMINKEYGRTVLTVTNNKSQDKVIEYLLNNCHDKETLTWYYTADSANIAIRALNISKPYFDRILRELLELGVLHKKARAVYILSKEYFQVKEDKA